MDLDRNIAYYCYVRYLLLVLSVIVFSSRIYSQDTLTTQPVFYSLSAYYGFFHVHTNKLSTYGGVNPVGIEFEISQLLLSNKIKSSFWFVPKWGIGLNYVDFQHEDLGYSIHAVAYFEPFIKINRKWRFSAKFGTGVAFVSNPYHVETNPYNKTYSTKLVFPLVGGASAYYCINNHWSIKSTVSFRHISNGGIKQPNLGLNYPALSMAAEYTMHKYEIKDLEMVDVFKYRKRKELLVGYTLKSDTISEEYRQVVVFTYNRSVRGGRINAFTLAAIIEYQQMINSDDELDQWSVAPLIGNEFVLQKVRFGQQLGFYVVRGMKAPNLLLQQYYLRYLMGTHLTTGINLKVHGRVADYLTLQLGYVF